MNPISLGNAMTLQIQATPSFTRIAKKLHPQDKKALDAAVSHIANHPLKGQEKKGDLTSVFVYKFKLNKQETLLAYTLVPNKLNPESVVLLAVGSHENFYETLKRGKVGAGSTSFEGIDSGSSPE